MHHDDVFGEIFIKPNNYMKATYTLYAIGSSDVYTEIEIAVNSTSDVHTEITPRAIGISEFNTEIDIKYGGYSEILTEIQPIGHMNMPTEIEVRPGNRMWALFEIQQPPRITSTFNPVRDSLTREKDEFAAINYGGNYSLTVGKFDDDIHRSYIYFSFTDWNPQYLVLDSKLRLYYNGTIPEGAKFNIYTVSEHWTEYGITHLNRPLSVDLITDEYENNRENRYLEFDFTEIVQKWTAKKEENYGILIELAEDSIEFLATFRSRESIRPPELVITYYDTRVYSAGRSSVPIEIFVWHARNSDVLTEIEVHSVVDNSDIPTELYVHRYEVPVPHDKETEITVTRTLVHSEVSVSVRNEDEKLTEISVRQPGVSKKDIELVVSKPYQFVEIFVAYTDEKHTDIVVQRREVSEVLSEITVSREQIYSDIYVKHTDSIDTEITVQRYNDDELDAEITVTRDYTFVELTVKLSDNSDVETEIYARAVRNSDVLTDISVTRQEIPTEITVTHYHDIESEIFVKYTDDVETEITITHFSDVLVDIDVKSTSQTDLEITISKPYIYTDITVPYWDDSDIPTEILPRILRASDVETEITIRTKGGAYAFIF